jgi:hypothetical protein
MNVALIVNWQVGELDLREHDLEWANFRAVEVDLLEYYLGFE